MHLYAEPRISVRHNISYTGIARTAVCGVGMGLDFYFQSANTSTSKSGVERFSGWDFSALGISPVDVFQTNASNGFFYCGNGNI